MDRESSKAVKRPSEGIKTCIPGWTRVMRWLVRSTGLVLLLAVALLLVLNLAIRPYSFITERLGKNPEKGHDPRYTPSALANVYPDKSDTEIAAILDDTRESRPTGPTVIDPPPFTSKHVNICPEGYRLIEGQMPFSEDPAHRNLFVFGGSTTWGYGLPDGETIASHLQRHLNSGGNAPIYRVVNYGVCASFSTYERRHLKRLIDAGRKPDHVVFIDGLNEFCRIPLNRPRENEPTGMSMPPLIDRWIIRPTLFWREQFGGARQGKDAVVEYDDSDLERACDEFVVNWREIRTLCAAHGIGCTLVLQPVPVYGYPLEDSLFLSEEDLQGDKSYYLAARKGYEMLLKGNRLHDVKFLNLHLLRCEGYEYLDTCHYTSRYASEIARVLAEQILSARSGANPR